MRRLRRIRGRIGAAGLVLLVAIGIASVLAASARSGVAKATRGYDRPPQAPAAPPSQAPAASPSQAPAGPPSQAPAAPPSQAAAGPAPAGPASSGPAPHGQGGQPAQGHPAHGGPASQQSGQPSQGAGGGRPTAYVPASLLAAASASPDAAFDVIVQGQGAHGADAAAAGVAAAAQAAPGRARGLGRTLSSVGGASAQLTGRQLLDLASRPGIAAITTDAPVKLAGNVVGQRAGGFSNQQLWPYASGVAAAWPQATSGLHAQPPAIAVVDSGVDTHRADLAGRVIAQASLTSLPGDSPGDGYGHGTFVAGIAADSANGYAGAAPTAPIVSLDVLNDQGFGLTSDVIAACDWILQHKDQYDIRVANFSLHSASPASVFWDPLDRAVEKLWFAGVTVVAASGNYAHGGLPSRVLFAPGNDPFVLTVGADDLHGTVTAADDTAAPWSSYGYTLDGFAKPELGAPGRYLVGPVPQGATLTQERPANVVSPGYMELSGTSFAAPVVAGEAAYLLALHPDWTPDQVKGALMLSAQKLPSAAPLSEGVGLVNGMAADAVQSPPNPNRALDAFLVPDPSGSPYPVFDTAAWANAARSAVSWSDVSWSDVSWSDAAWSAVSWSDVSWSDASWATVSWSDVSWSDVSWSDVSWSDAALLDNAAGETGAPPLLDPTQLAIAQSLLGVQIAPDGTVSVGSG